MFGSIQLHEKPRPTSQTDSLFRTHFSSRHHDEDQTSVGFGWWQLKDFLEFSPPNFLGKMIIPNLDGCIYFSKGVGKNHQTSWGVGEHLGFFG